MEAKERARHGCAAKGAWPADAGVRGDAAGPWGEDPAGASGAASEAACGVQLVGIRKRFGTVTAVDDVSLAVREGELLVIVGPSGCGKTTLLRIIAGLEQPDAGRVFIQGKDVSRMPPERRDVGFVFQQFALFPNMTVAGNVEYGLKRRGVPAAERKRRVEEILSMVGLERLGQRRPDQLSAGQQQRVALARALAPRPKTLLLDEPLSALDAAIRVRLREELRQMQRRLGITTILVTHDQEEALAVADRVAVMNEGRLEQVGTPWDLYDRPQTLFVARFIGRGNLFPARVEGERVEVEGFGPVPKSALPDGPIVPDGPAQVLVRPEAVIVQMEDDVAAAQAGAAREQLAVGARAQLTAAARLADVTFGGERSLLTLTLEALPERTVLAAAPSVWAQRLAQRRGQRVTVVIPADALRLLPEH